MMSNEVTIKERASYANEDVELFFFLERTFSKGLLDELNSIRYA